jgi:hypothetical protein
LTASRLVSTTIDQSGFAGAALGDERDDIDGGIGPSVVEVFQLRLTADEVFIRRLGQVGDIHLD